MFQNGWLVSHFPSIMLRWKIGVILIRDFVPTGSEISSRKLCETQILISCENGKIESKSTAGLVFVSSVEWAFP
jgi:hypothetical protein